jgi:hypothetical protein
LKSIDRYPIPPLKLRSLQPTTPGNWSRDFLRAERKETIETFDEQHLTNLITKEARLTDTAFNSSNIVRILNTELSDIATIKGTLSTTDPKLIYLEKQKDAINTIKKEIR